MMEQFKYMVRVGCVTFNHALYIEDAMNGFCMQETTFPFICTVVDDASTDGESEVIRLYLQKHFDLEDKDIVRNEETDDYVMTFARHKINHNCFFAVYYLKYNHYSINKNKNLYVKEWQENSKYVAICEGDDYWIAPNKLQRQVDFLENHNNYVMCFHNAFITEQNGNQISYRMFNAEYEEMDLAFEDAIKRWYVPTASMLFRNEILKKQPSWLVQIYSGDLSLILQLTLLGKVRYINCIMSVYRKVLNGESMSQKVESIWALNQKVILYESFLNCPSLTESQRKALRNEIAHRQLLLSYAQNKKNKNYLALLKPRYWSLLYNYGKKWIWNKLTL